jgi:hypothetical protein
MILLLLKVQQGFLHEPYLLAIHLARFFPFPKSTTTPAQIATPPTATIVRETDGEVRLLYTSGLAATATNTMPVMAAISPFLGAGR